MEGQSPSEDVLATQSRMSFAAGSGSHFMFHVLLHLNLLTSYSFRTNLVLEYVFLSCQGCTRVQEISREKLKREDRYIHEGKPSLPFTASTQQAVAAAQAFIPEPPGREKHKL